MKKTDIFNTTMTTSNSSEIGKFDRNWLIDSFSSLFWFSREIWDRNRNWLIDIQRAFSDDSAFLYYRHSILFFLSALASPSPKITCRVIRKSWLYFSPHHCRISASFHSTYKYQNTQGNNHFHMNSFHSFRVFHRLSLTLLAFISITID